MAFPVNSRDSLQEQCVVKQEPFKCLGTWKAFKYPSSGFRCQVFYTLCIFGQYIHLRLIENQYFVVNKRLNIWSLQPWSTHTGVFQHIAWLDLHWRLCEYRLGLIDIFDTLLTPICCICSSSSSASASASSSLPSLSLLLVHELGDPKEISTKVPLNQSAITANICENVELHWYMILHFHIFFLP